METLSQAIRDKKILFITMKNLDYIRISQETALLSYKCSDLQIIGSHSGNYLIRIITVFFRILAVNPTKYDIIFFSFLPQIIIPLFKRRFSRSYIIADVFVSMYDTICLDRCVCRPNGIFSRLLHKLDEITLKRADMVITDTKAHADYYASEFGANRDKMITLYLEADHDIYHPMKVERPTELIDKYVILYFGSILPLQGVDIVIEAYTKLASYGNIHMFLIGPVKNKAALALPSQSNLTLIDWLPQDELARYISMSDLCLAGHFNANIPKASRTIPGKVYIYEAMNKPMILGDSTANHELFTEDETHIFVPMGNSDKLKEAIINMIRD